LPAPGGTGDIQAFATVGAGCLGEEENTAMPSKQLVGTRTWFSGRVTCLCYLAHVIGSPGDWLMTHTLANGQPAAAAYHRDGAGTYHAHGVAVLTATLAGIARITVFPGGPGPVAKFAFPPTQPERGQ
jgi:RNA polymerase sigma-70 factor, ECF subfamily